MLQWRRVEIASSCYDTHVTPMCTICRVEAQAHVSIHRHSLRHWPPTMHIHRSSQRDHKAWEWLLVALCYQLTRGWPSAVWTVGQKENLSPNGCDKKIRYKYTYKRRSDVVGPCCP